MIRDDELDRVLATWLADGGERAPRRYVAAALGDIASTKQRPGWLSVVDGWPVNRTERTRVLLVAALLATLVLGVAIGIGSQLLQSPTPVPPAPPAEVVPSAALPALPALVPQAIEDWPVSVSIPEGWTEIEGQCCDYRQFSGTEPEGHLSIGHESPYWTAVCAPECTDIEVPQTIPYDPEKQLTALKAAVAEAAGSDEWADLPPDVLPDATGGARLDTTGPAADGREWRRVHVVGLKARNLVTVTFSQPAEVFDEALLDAILADTTLLEAPVYSDGDLLASSSGAAFTMPIPGSWWYTEQPALEGLPLGGVRRFGEGEVLVSIGSLDGTLGWCDPACRRIEGLTTLDALVAAVGDVPDLGAPVDAILGGEPARSMDSSAPPARRLVVAMHEGRPVAFQIDTRDWDVAPGIIDEMVAGFAFKDPVLEPVEQRVRTADDRVELGLSAAWEPPDTDGGPFRRSPAQVMTVRIGSKDGTIVTCDEPAAVWERCREITATSLPALAQAVLPATIDDGGVPPPEPRLDDVMLDGEQAFAIRMQGFESPSDGAHELAYVVAMHEGRPVIVRLYTSEDELAGLESVIAGFRFVD